MIHSIQAIYLGSPWNNSLMFGQIDFDWNRLFPTSLESEFDWIGSVGHANMPNRY